MTLQMFRTFDQLAAKLLDVSGDDEDGAHDLSHIVRVWRNAKLIQREEGGDLEALAAAVLLHDCVQVAFAQQGVTTSGEGSACSPRSTWVGAIPRRHRCQRD
jgi:HD superfamily phosphodiesterase